MIGTLLRIGWINFRRDRVVQALTFVLPILFFSIFALVFANQKTAMSRITVPLVDEDQSEYSKKLVAALAAEGGLDIRTTSEANGKGDPLSAAGAEALVRNGVNGIAVILPKGLGASHRFWSDGSTPAARVKVLSDVSDPVSSQMVMGLLQKVAFTAAPEMLATDGIAMFEKYGGPLTPAQRQSSETWLRDISARQSAGGAGTTASGGAGAVGLPVDVVNVLHPGEGNTATVSFYAAGIGVMFLLFSCAGAGGGLLDEVETGTLGRLVGSRAGMSGVLLGKWLFVALTGVTQLTAMFLWGMVMFKLPLAGHVTGFIVMTVFTAAAASGFGLVLATLSRSRQQLSGLSTILILTMSSLGGSMFPRFLMSETMQTFGLVTFNAWALDGYLKVFWREAPVTALWPQVLVLGGLTVLFLAVARRLARRWETL